MGMLDYVFITLSNRFKTDNAFAVLWGAPLKKFSFGKKCLKTDFFYKTHFFEKKTESKGPQLRLKTILFILFTNFLQPSTDSTKCQPAN